MFKCVDLLIIISVISKSLSYQAIDILKNIYLSYSHLYVYTFMHIHSNKNMFIKFQNKITW